MNSFGTESNDVAKLFLEKGILTEFQYSLVRRRQKTFHISDHKAILDLNLISEVETLKALAELKGIEFIDLTNVQIPKEIRDCIPLETLLHYRILPIGISPDGNLIIASSEILTLNEIGTLRLQVNKRIHNVLSTPSMIRDLTRKTYGLGVDMIVKLRSDQGNSTSSNQEVVFDIKEQDDSLS